MKDTIRRMPMFSFHDRTGIVAYLEKKASEGWMLEKTSARGWVFRRIEPAKIHFAVTYFPDASSFDPGPSENQLRFQDFCEHTGWKLITTSAQMQIFCNADENPIPIETDPEIELENIHASAKKAILPTYFLQMILALVQIGLVASRLSWDFVGALSENVTFFNLFCWGMVFLLSFIEVIGYYRFRRAAKKAIETDGSFVETKSHRNVQVLVLIFVMTALFMMLMSYGGRLAAVVVFHIFAIFAVIVLVQGISAYMKKKQVSAKKNRNISMLLTFFFTLIVMAVMVFSVVRSLDALQGERKPVRTIVTTTLSGRTADFHIYHDDIPLKVEDLMELDFGDYTYEFGRENASFVMERFEAGQDAPYGVTEIPELGYIVVKVKLPLLYDLTKKAMLEDFAGEIYENAKEGEVYLDIAMPIDGSLWGAKEAYQLMAEGEWKQDYLLCFDDCFVEILPSWELSEEQMAIVGERLGK